MFSLPLIEILWQKWLWIQPVKEFKEQYREQLAEEPQAV
jgi:hypothetical protein